MPLSSLFLKALQLISQNSVNGLLHLLEEASPELRVRVLNLMATPQLGRTAGSFIRRKQLDIADFPLVRKRLLKSTMRHFLRKSLKPQSHPLHKPMTRTIELLQQNKETLPMLLRDLKFHKRAQRIVAPDSEIASAKECFVYSHYAVPESKHEP